MDYIKNKGIVLFLFIVLQGCDSSAVSPVDPAEWIVEDKAHRVCEPGWDETANNQPVVVPDSAEYVKETDYKIAAYKQTRGGSVGLESTYRRDASLVGSSAESGEPVVFIGGIWGFCYEWGYEYELKVVSYYDTLIADGSTQLYLEKLISKSEVSSDMSFEMKLVLDGESLFENGPLFGHESFYPVMDLIDVRDLGGNQFELNDGKNFTCSDAVCASLRDYRTQKMVVQARFGFGETKQDPLVLKEILCASSYQLYEANCP